MTLTMKQTPKILLDPLKFSLDFKMGVSFRTRGAVCIDS
jgi:hypothetical protein